MLLDRSHFRAVRRPDRLPGNGVPRHDRMARPLNARESKPYPESWENVAELRVFRASAREWPKLIGWRADMRKRGWKLLRVTSDDKELVAVFGKTKSDLHPASA